jgi:hypothetical protein
MQPAEKRGNVNSFWKKPARLWRRRRASGAPTEPGTVTQVDSGSLEEMVRIATDAKVQAADEQDTLFIDVDSKRMLSLGDIKRLRSTPEFPVDI